MRFFRRGKSKILFLPAVADTQNPTRSEMDAGTDVSPQVADIAGFQLENSNIPTPNLEDQFTPQIEGEDTTADSSLTFYDLDQESTNDIRTALDKGTEGYILLLPYGDVEARRCEVWPARSSGVNDEWSMGNDPARYVVGFAVTAPPEQNATVPAEAS